MARLIWSPRALDDIEWQASYVARDAPIAARRLVQRILHRAEILESHPHSGSVIAEDPTGAYREVLQGNHRIIYRMEGDVVYVVAVHHAARLLDMDDLD